MEEADEDGEAVGEVEADGGDGGGGGEGDAGAEGGDGEEEGEEGGEADGADGGLEADGDGGEEGREAAVAGEAEHHARVGREGEEAGVPDADDDEGHEGDGALVAEDVDQDLRHGLADRAVDCVGEVLDAEEEGDEEEEAEDGGDADGHEDAERGVPGGVVGLFGHVGGGVEACDGVLGHEDAADGDVSGRGAHAPTGVSGSVVEGGEDCLGGLMGGCFGEDGDGETGHSDRVEDDGGVVEVAKDRNPEAVDEGVGDEKSGIDSDGFAGGGGIRGADGGGGGDETGAAECDASGDGDLTEEIEPAGDPGVKGRLVLWSQDGSPEVGTTTGRDGGHNLGHTEGDEEGEKADDDPTDGHDAWSSSG